MTVRSLKGIVLTGVIIESRNSIFFDGLNDNHFSEQNDCHGYNHHKPTNLFHSPKADISARTTSSLSKLIRSAWIQSRQGVLGAVGHWVLNDSWVPFVRGLKMASGQFGPQVLACRCTVSMIEVRDFSLHLVPRPTASRSFCKSTGPVHIWSNCVALKSTT